MAYSNIYYDFFNNKIHLWEYVDGKRKKIEEKIKYQCYIKSDNGEHWDIYGNRVEKREYDTKKSIKNLKESGAYLCESDVKEDIKYLQKKYCSDLLDGYDDLNICYLDIEVAGEKEFPKPEEAKYPINLITMKTSKKNQLVTFGLDEYTGSSDQVKNYYYNPNEKELLTKFIKFFRKQKIDILTGWNVQTFDVMYIINRCKNLGIDVYLSPVNKYNENKQTGVYSICGISILDGLEMYKKYTRVNRESYNLNFIGQTEVDEGKLDYEGSINDLWKDDWNKFVEYNIQDVLLVEKIENKLKYIQLVVSFAYQALVPFESVLSSIAVSTGFILKYLHEQDLVMPDRKDNDEESFPGAYVYAREGMYNKVVSFDVQSLYPTIMIMFNISPETLVTNQEEINRLDSIGMLIKTPLDGVYYTKEKEGVIPKIITKVFNDRLMYKKKLKECYKKNDKVGIDYYDRMQYIAKIFINSLYGICGNRFFHFYNINNAKCVTVSGQSIIKYLSKTTCNYFENSYIHNGNKVKLSGDMLVVNDTDSAYLSLKELKEKIDPESDFVEWSMSFTENVMQPFFDKIMNIYSKKYNVNNLIKFQREKVIDKILVMAKKKYATYTLVNEDEIYEKPKVTITGIEVVRTSTPSFCRKKILNVIEKIFEWNDKNKIISLLKQIKKEFINTSINDIAFPRGIKDYNKYINGIDLNNCSGGVNYMKSTPIHVKSAINYNYLNKKYEIGGIPIYNGTKMKFIFVKPQNEIRAETIGFVWTYPKKFNKIFKIDYQKQWEKSFQDVVERFFIVMNWGKIDLKQGNLKKFIKFGGN